MTQSARQKTFVPVPVLDIPTDDHISLEAVRLRIATDRVLLIPGIARQIASGSVIYGIVIKLCVSLNPDGCRCHKRVSPDRRDA